MCVYFPLILGTLPYYVHYTLYLYHIDYVPMCLKRRVRSMWVVNMSKMARARCDLALALGAKCLLLGNTHRTTCISEQWTAVRAEPNRSPSARLITKRPTF
ncbi:hypothetical protein BD310DRAFT_933261 [Dichomitus squalens]|uniref:Uncharacterized protein n=1 Tax=Dichomitus squalens TaxID=114155 RepID=A0A4Q9PN06_9APHY|nr:hypothetical protein BD310DRAFT_933261 [Dichomitus squalens]